MSGALGIIVDDGQASASGAAIFFEFPAVSHLKIITPHRALAIASAYTVTMVNSIPRAAAYLAESSTISIEAVREDQDEEIESYQSAIDIDDIEAKGNGHYLPKPSTSDKRTKIDHSQLKNNLKKASEGIIVSNTQSEYRR
jgi:hypothetical protein